MNEKLCPFCSKPVRSDALATLSCKLCGMFINDTETQYIYDTRTGNSLYFCCVKCRKTYLSTLSQEQIENTIETVEDIIEDISIERDGEDIYVHYRKYVQETTYRIDRSSYH
jgi:YHS domain-containing protein